MNNQHLLVIYIDYVANSIIVNQIKLTFNNVNKLNFELIKINIYFFQFRFRIFHKIEKFNIVSNVLNRFSIVRHFNSNTKIDNFDLKIYYFYIDETNFNENSIRITLIEMLSNFCKKFIIEYQKNVN